jgi:PAS domain-containing protein
MKNININSDKSIASDNKIDLEYFKAVFDELPECFQILSQDGYILEVNQLWLDILGYRKKDVICFF